MLHFMFMSSMKNEMLVNSDVKIESYFDSMFVSLSYYAENNIPNYNTITKIPREYMNYINTVKYVNNCKGMLNLCSKLSGDLTLLLNTNYVRNMSEMFCECGKLNAILCEFNTSNVTDMSKMFSGCTSLTHITRMDRWNTSNVTNMSRMFDNCGSISELEVINFNTAKVTDMSFMFRSCEKLDALDLSNWDTSKVTDMNSIFDGCSSLNTIIGTIDLSSCKNVDMMFRDTPDLRDVRLKNVPKSLLGVDGPVDPGGETPEISLLNSGGTLNKTYIIDNILEDR